MTMLKLDFDPSPYGGFSERFCSRGAVFALRILLSNPDVLPGYMDDCEYLLKLLGGDAVWPDRLSRLLAKGLANEDDGIDAAIVDADAIKIASLLKKRRAYRVYSDVITRCFADDPKLVVEALEDNLLRLKPQSLLKAQANPNIARLGKMLGLTQTEMQILDFAELRGFGLFHNFLRGISGFGANEAFDLLASAINAPVALVRASLRADAPLRTLGLVRIDLAPNDLEDFIRLADAGQRFLAEQFSSTKDMLRVILQSSPEPTLMVEDFEHLRKEFTWLATFLKNAVANKVKGANILFYGAPGTGKSEFARLLAENAGLEVFDVKSSNEEGESVSGQTRMAHFALSQRFLSERGNTMVVFDEIEDVFPDSGMAFAAVFGGVRGAAKPDQSKAWLNQQLERSSVPAIWISNSIDGIDDAYLRRFAFHIEFRTPPKSARMRVIQRCLNDLRVSDKLATMLAADDTLSPAQIRQASRFASLCTTKGTAIDESVLMHAVRSSQAAMGRTSAGFRQATEHAGCSFAYLNLNSDFPLAKVEQALKANPAATMCFHGVPGAGKTSLAHHLAESIGRPLLVKRASDILGKYVGESEKLIAAMFREANQEGAVLLLDEADSFLRSRQQAGHSWEVTQVNELLQQMEMFDGLFICTTNLMDDVDEAALRRFSFKIRFDPLTPAQSMALFAEIVFGSPSAALPQNIEALLKKLGSLTPGDFSTVQRQEKLLGERYSPLDFLHHLEHECAMKKGGIPRKIGFFG